ncbi:hypothetical protein NQ176_g4778 [Zarea fungicola]|uniref:Uncharacterized protein n=1 Tax=Zarea fungicola TaxID=93591 RepID=A0ACC1NDN1_9HYPO|nr:hypothetical protein NQ176_g4778 [Lecanicillium fungicola]
MTATLVTAAFITLKQGWAPCPGGITFTAGSGLWEATSPYSWWRRMTTCPVEPLQCIRAYNVLDLHVPSDIDEFAQAILVVIYGLEQVKQWKDRTATEET